jgi:DsbC/DsbD-like thiol-disulfide interchange protein/cytochrome c biogenesis protein CcdA
MPAAPPPARTPANRRYLRAVTVLWQVLLAALALLSTPAPAQPAPATHIAASLIAERAAKPGETITLAIHMQPAPSWHGYWQNPGDAGFGMRLDWRLPPGAKAGKPRYPVPETLLIAGLMNHVFNRDYALLVPLTVPAGAKPGTTLPIALEAGWLACTDQVCVPEQARLQAAVTITATPTASDPRFDTWRAKLPAPLPAGARFAIDGRQLQLAIPLPASVPLAAPHVFPLADRVIDYAAKQQFARKGDWLLVTFARPQTMATATGEFAGVLRLDAAGNGLAFAARPGQVPTGGTPLETGDASTTPARLTLLVLAALAGGLLLNVMPCVFPILSLKALSLARAGESAHGARAEGLAYAAGVIAACLALGATMLALRAAGQEVGWAFQLQEPLVVAGLLALTVAITANLAGVYEFAVPGFITRGAAPNHGAAGAFLTGLIAAFVATPCTGPFMATAMGAALLLPAAQALLLFASLGLGIALPFVALAFVPALRRRLPRPGAWMDRFRKAMAVPMALTALALAWLASRVGGTHFALASAAAALTLFALLAWLGRRQRQGRAAAPAVLVGILLTGTIAALTLPHTIRPPAARAGLPGTQAYSDRALAAARATGRPVFAWFTADWCLTCKVNEAVAIDTTATRTAFAHAGVIVIRGDWTRRDPAITRYLEAHGAAGVPLYVWYAAGDRSEGKVLPQVLSPNTLSALVR